MKPLRMCAAVVAVLQIVCAGGCTSIDGSSSKSVLIPSQVLNVSSSLSVPLESIAAGALLFVIIDPLAPNWHIEQIRTGENRFRIAMRKKRFTTGGDGEVMPAFYRRAEQIVSELGARNYRILEFNEGVDSAVPIAQRVAQGVVEIIR